MTAAARGAREWALGLVVLGVCGLLLEGGLRLAGRPRGDTCWAPKADYWIPDDTLGFAYRPGAQVAGGTINALGLRGPVPPRAKPPGERRVLYVGDSSVYGFGVSDDEAFWSVATRALDARDAARRVVPLVGAAPGYSSYQSRVLLGELLAWAPDEVVFYVGAHNDHRRRRYYADAEIPTRMARRHAGWHESAALRALEQVTDRLGKWLEREVADPEAILRVPPEAFEANLRAMLDAAREAGARPLLLLPPFTATLAARHAAVPRYREILLRVAAEEGVAHVDLQPRFEGEDAASLFLPDDDFHPSARGHRVIAEAVVGASR